MTAESVRWRCTRCDVSVGRIDGELVAFPECWSQRDGEIFCLSCSRAQAGDAAIDTAPAATSHEDRSRIRRTAVIEFEIDRVPEAPNRSIAQACRTSSSVVKAVRERMSPVGASDGYGPERDG